MKYRKNYLKEFSLFALFFFWSLFTTAIRFFIFHDNSDFSYNWHLLTAVFIALPLALSFPLNKNIKALKVFMFITVSSLSIIALFSILLVLFQLVFINPFNADSVIGLVYITKSYRLSIWANPNLVGMIYLTVLDLALFLFNFSKTKVMRYYYLLCVILSGSVLVLSGSRTCIYAFIIAFSFYQTFNFYKKSKDTSKNLKLKTCGIFILNCFSLLVLSYLLVTIIDKLSLLLSSLINPENLSSTFFKTQPVWDISTSRPITTLTQGRVAIWVNAIKTMFTYPYTFLIGTSVSEVANVVFLYSPYLYPHLHNSWLHILVAYGLPGLFLALGFTYQSLKIMLKNLILDDSLIPKEIKMIPFLVLALLITTFLESSLFNLSNIIYFENTWFFIFLGYIFVYFKSDWKSH